MYFRIGIAICFKHFMHINVFLRNVILNFDKDSLDSLDKSNATIIIRYDPSLRYKEYFII